MWSNINYPFYTFLTCCLILIFITHIIFIYYLNFAYSRNVFFNHHWTIHVNNFVLLIFLSYIFFLSLPSFIQRSLAYDGNNRVKYYVDRKISDRNQKLCIFYISKAFLQFDEKLFIIYKLLENWEYRTREMLYWQKFFNWNVQDTRISEYRNQ